ncbi:unnamed protein product [Cladocopium goreaui]|uniref:Amine oxidase domain-containing protein n=1 Tax=Cladocopium goreaui TaxID=2562237 RepID=A0A9P1CN94_9DINO|nr:unnamed protein product [Cladocopium goreaui]
MVSMSPVNYAGLALYFVVLGVSMVASYYMQRSPMRRAASWLLIAITWFYILRFTITYPQTSWYQEGLNLFDVAYADVIWGGANGNWGYTQQLLCWAIVATVWTLEAPICYQLFGLFGAMSGSFCLIDVERKPVEEVHLSLLLACLLAFGCVWMLPMSQNYREMSWWLWLLHACLILPKCLQLGRKIPRGVVYLVLAALSFLTHRFSTRPRHWPSTDCQISITVDVAASSLLTLRFIYIRLGAAPDAAAALGAALGALLTFLASPGAVLGLFCGFHDHRLRSWLVTSLQRFLAGRAGAAGATNLGYWKAAASYDEACKDLAELVGSEATLNVNDAVLCVGCGFSAELAFFRQRFGPRRVAGLDAAASGDDVRRGTVETMATGAQHFRFNEFTKVLAVDCAYHFERVKFFQEAKKVARETLTLTDVVLRNKDAPVWLRMALCAMDIPWSNHWTEQEYRSKLHQAGFSIVSWRSLEPHVLASERWPGTGLLAPHLDYVLIHAEVRKSDRPSAAVIGSGMSGLIAAHLLEETHEVVIYEAGPKCGLVGLQEQLAPSLAVDVPLRFMMPHYYRNLLEVIRDLHIPTKAVPYNASYQSGDEMLLVTSTGWLGHILQHLKYVPYLARLMFTVFFREELPGESFLEYMQRFQLHRHEAYRIYSLHLSWMLSCTYDQANATPAGVVLGFIRASNPFVRMYQASGNILRIYPTMKALQDRLLTGKVIRVNSPVTSFYDESARRSRCIDGTCYDVVLVATDAPAAGYLLGGEWQSRLSKIHYQKGRIIVHKDPRLMPARKEDWRTFNIREDGPKGTCQITVWLNKFWGREDLTEDLFETWNPSEECKAELKVKDVELARATYTKEMHQLWSWIEEKQGEDGFYVAGAYALEGMSLLEQACISAQRAVAAVHRDAERGSELSDEHPSGQRKKEN